MHSHVNTAQGKQDGPNKENQSPFDSPSQKQKHQHSDGKRTGRMPGEKAIIRWAFQDPDQSVDLLGIIGPQTRNGYFGPMGNGGYKKCQSK